MVQQDISQDATVSGAREKKLRCKEEFAFEDHPATVY